MLTNNRSLLAIVSVMVLGLLVTGVVGLAAGNGPMDGSCDDPLQRDADNDGILNHEDDDWTPLEDGSGYGASGEKSQGQGLGEGEYGSGDGDGPHGNQDKGNGQGRGQGKGKA